MNMWTGQDKPRSAASASASNGFFYPAGPALSAVRTQAARAMHVRRPLQNWELEDARVVQQQLLPHSGPTVTGLDYAGQCRPAASVGGDYYDFLPISERLTGFAIGDVSGKGIAAALLMATLQASLRGLVVSNSRELPAMMAALNRMMFDATPANRFATLFYGAYDVASREFAYVNGGHNAPLLLRGEQVLRLREGGPAVGLLRLAEYEQSCVRLQPGDVLLLYTDGISETMNDAMDEFGEERLENAMQRGRSLPSAALIEEVFAACDHFAAGAPQNDDMTMLAVRAV